MKTKGLVLAVVLIFGSASVAAAECAWVLWYDREINSLVQSGRSSQSWTPQSGYPTHKECVAKRDSSAAFYANSVRKDPDTKKFDYNPGDSSLAWTQGTDIWTVSYTCLPDTIDPREKKE